MQNNLSLTSDAYASIKGSSAYPNIQGEVHFYGVHGGTIVTVHITGLPENSSGNFYGFHIHEGRSCTGNTADPFKDAEGTTIRKRNRILIMSVICLYLWEIKEWYGANSTQIDSSRKTSLEEQLSFMICLMISEASLPEIPAQK